MADPNRCYAPPHQPRPEQKAYVDLALEEGIADKLDEFTLLTATRGGPQVVALRSKST